MVNSTLLIPNNAAITKVTSKIAPTLGNSRRLMAIAQLNCITLGRLTAKQLGKYAAGSTLKTWAGTVYKLDGKKLSFALRPTATACAV